MSVVIVAEKPSVARDIARVVGADQKREGYLETRDGNRIVTWAFGHLVQYADPDAYGAAWSGRWDFGQLPMIPDRWQLKVGKGAGKQFAVVKRLLNAADRVICATDAGREGEHIFRLIYEHAGCRAPVQRLWVSSLTREALSAGLDNLFPGKTFDPLAQAARVRAQADWLVGMNLTRAYTVRNGTLCSVGRVQTPTLAMVVRRDKQIKTFSQVDLLRKSLPTSNPASTRFTPAPANRTTPARPNGYAASSAAKTPTPSSRAPGAGRRSLPRWKPARSGTVRRRCTT